MEFYMKLGIDGAFTDFPAAGVSALKAVRGN
jgi:glycerophosphoryl diester phosphodiesterase